MSVDGLIAARRELAHAFTAAVQSATGWSLPDEDEIAASADGGWAIEAVRTTPHAVLYLSLGRVWERSYDRISLLVADAIGDDRRYAEIGFEVVSPEAIASSVEPILRRAPTLHVASLSELVRELLPKTRGLAWQHQDEPLAAITPSTISPEPYAASVPTRTGR